MAEHKLISDRRDWSDLPSDIIHLIAKKIPHLLDFVHFHVTCKSWCSSTPLSEFTPRFPWLLEVCHKTKDLTSAPTTRLCLYSTSSGELLTIPIKESRWFRGSSNNYLPVIDPRTGVISLLNPLTNDEFVVPLIHDRRKTFSSMIVGTEPGSIRDHRILIADHGLNFDDQWAVYDPHHGRWSEHEGFCLPYCYCRGMFFHTWKFAGSETEVVDVSSKKSLYMIPPHGDEIADAYPSGEELPYIKFYKSYIVDSSGEILRVNWYYPQKHVTDCKFQIYRLTFDKAGEQPYWVKISDIGDQIFFVEVTNGISMAANGFSMTVEPTIDLRGGRIYFIDPRSGKPFVYDIVTGRTERLPCPFEKCTWFLPGLL